MSNSLTKLDFFLLSATLHTTTEPFWSKISVTAEFDPETFDIYIVISWNF